LKAGIGEQAHLDFSVGSIGLLEVPPAYYLQYKNDINLYQRYAEAGAMLEYILLLDPGVLPLNEDAVRRAIRLAIDHRGLADVTLGGAALSTYSLPTEEARLDYRSRVERAKASLADYGDLALNPLVIAYPGSDIRARLIAEKIAINLKPLGFEVTTRAIQNFGESANNIAAGILLMPFPMSTVSEPAPTTVVELASEWGFGSDTLTSYAQRGDTSEDFYIPILRPQRLVVTGEDFLAPSFGMWGEIDFYRLSLG
jgi:ABC-type transport system substrate-binding protein